MHFELTHDLDSKNSFNHVKKSFLHLKTAQLFIISKLEDFMAKLDNFKVHLLVHLTNLISTLFCHENKNAFKFIVVSNF